MPQQQPTERPRVIDSESRRSTWSKWLFLPLRWVYKFWFALVFFGSLVVLYVPFRVLLYTPRRYDRAFRLKRKWAWFLQWACGVPMRLERAAPLPKAPYVICCNHSSYLDIIQMYNVLPEYFLFMGKYELLKWPLFNIFFKGMNIAVNRGSHVEAAKAFRKAAEAIDRGTSVALFPRRHHPGLHSASEALQGRSVQIGDREASAHRTHHLPGPLAALRRTHGVPKPCPTRGGTGHPTCSHPYRRAHHG
jgi:1-acyl-sn-glycerol-3-phosphate acyltransferase